MIVEPKTYSRKFVREERTIRARGRSIEDDQARCLLTCRRWALRWLDRYFRPGTVYAAPDIAVQRDPYIRAYEYFIHIDEAPL